MPATTLSRIAAILASILFAAGYRAWAGTAVAPGEVLAISLGAGLFTLAAGLAVQALAGGAGWRQAAVIRNLLGIAGLVVFATVLTFWARDAAAQRLGMATSGCNSPSSPRSPASSASARWSRATATIPAGCSAPAGRRPMSPSTCSRASAR
jgi:hypothetical protein